MTRESLGTLCRRTRLVRFWRSAIAGVLYRPVGDSVAGPCVVMAQGFSGTMDWIVPEFAATFADGGLTVLIFDYRYLGVIGGEPRQLIDTRRQRKDLHRASSSWSAKTSKRRIAQWGTSLGGNHAIQLGSGHQDRGGCR